MKKPEFHAEYNPTIFYFIPTICWMELEDEAGKHFGHTVQIHFFGISLQWFWEADKDGESTP